MSKREEEQKAEDHREFVSLFQETIARDPGSAIEKILFHIQDTGVPFPLPWHTVLTMAKDRLKEYTHTLEALEYHNGKCPVCEAVREQGHYPECILKRALRRDK